MNKNTILTLAIGLVIGMTGTLAVYAITKDDTSSAVMSNQTTTDHNAQMTAKLKDLTGDEFDKAFIAEMIMHHQGAIDMAVLTQNNAKHVEVKQLGKDIMAAQSREIDMMQTWQTDWNYKTTPQSHDMHNM